MKLILNASNGQIASATLLGDDGAPADDKTGVGDETTTGMSPDTFASWLSGELGFDAEVHNLDD